MVLETAFPIDTCQSRSARKSRRVSRKPLKRGTLSYADATPGGRALGEPGRDINYGRGCTSGNLHKESRQAYQMSYQAFTPLKPGSKDINQQVLEAWRTPKNPRDSEVMCDPTPGNRVLGEEGNDLCYGRGATLGGLYKESMKTYQGNFQKFAPKPRDALDINQQVLLHWRERVDEAAEYTGYEIAASNVPTLPARERVPPRSKSEDPRSGSSPRKSHVRSFKEVLSEKRGKMTTEIRTADDLKKILKSRFGNAVRGFRIGMDQNMGGSLDIAEFCAACRRLGLHGSLRSIFKSLDADGGGEVTLNEFDPVAYQAIAEFRALLSNQYRTIEAAWAALAGDSPGGISGEQFCVGCKRIGYEGDGMKLLRAIDLESFGNGRLTMDALEFLRLPSRLDRRKYVDRGKTIIVPRTRKPRMESAEDLKQAVKAMYGSLVHAWRAFSPGNAERINMAEFASTCRTLGLEGNVRSIFREMDYDGDGYITMVEFDPRAAKVVEDFGKFLTEKYGTRGTLQKAWTLGLAKDSPGGTSKEKFVQALEEMGYKGDPMEIVYYLDNDRFSTGRITMDELEFLGLPEDPDRDVVTSLF